MKSSLKFLSGSVIAVFIVAFIVARTNFIGSQRIVGNGKIATQTLTPAQFNALAVSGKFIIRVSQSQTPKISLTGDENILPYVENSVDGTCLHIAYKDHISISDNHPIEITISAPVINHITLNGKSILIAQNLKADTLSVDLHGRADASIDADVKNFTVESHGRAQAKIALVSAQTTQVIMQGRSDLNLSGKTEKLSINTEGAAIIDANALAAEQVSIQSSGKSSIKVHANQQLSVNSQGKSEIYYTGHPSIQKIMLGIGTLEKA